MYVTNKLLIMTVQQVKLRDYMQGHIFIIESQTKYHAVNSVEIPLSVEGILSGLVSSGHDAYSRCFDTPPRIKPTPYMERGRLTVSSWCGQHNNHTLVFS